MEIEEISEFIIKLETQSNLTEDENIIPLLEKANKYIIILNKYISEDVKTLKEFYIQYTFQNYQQLSQTIMNLLNQ